jgi:hypothetical protein
VTGQSDPEQVAVDAFQFEQGRADVTCTAGNFDPCGFFDCLTVTRTVNAPSYSAYSFGEIRYLLIGQV